MSTIDITAVQTLLKADKEALTALPQAVKNLQEGKVKVLAVSGKKGSGKDTFTAELGKHLGTPFMMYAFAAELKAEAQQMFNIIEMLYKSGSTEDMIVNDLIQVYRLWSIPFITKNMHLFVQGIIEDLNNGISPDSYKRSPGVWRGLQLLGTDIRRQQDNDYWVKKTIAFIVKKLEEGTSVFVSDVRFLNEIKAMEDLGAPTIRMEVTPEVQRERLIGRDGTEPTQEALTHPSEVSLDDYVFDIVVDNNGSLSIAENVHRVSVLV